MEDIDTGDLRPLVRYKIQNACRSVLRTDAKFWKFHLIWEDWRPGSWIPDRGMMDILIQCCHNARVNTACLFIYTNWRLHMNVKLGQLDLFSPLCKICEKTELCSQGLADAWLMFCPSGSGQCPNYGKLPGYKSVCAYYYKMLRNNMNNWAINLYKENNSQAILSRKGGQNEFRRATYQTTFIT